ncbi:MAG: hypothetical protein NTV48_01785 [Candidatus Vogelbacteria bacterium]|nr:hypothetical protein [Candidatus Vogelbacteria bacterium]
MTLATSASNAGYILNRNDELILATQDIFYNHEFPAIFLPKKSSNWQEASITVTTEEDVKKLKKKGLEIIIQKSLGSEFFYKTKTLLNPVSDTKRRIEQFDKNYQHKIYHSFSKDKIKDFYYKWKKQKKRKNDNFADAESFFFFCLDNLKKYKIKQVYITVNDKLVGFAWGLKHQSGNWVGLQLKAIYRFKGLSRFLHHQRAKLFADKDLFTLGTGAQEPGIIQFKKELGPFQEKNYYYVLTGKKKLRK